eukprot:s1348_g11.t1
MNQQRSAFCPQLREKDASREQHERLKGLRFKGDEECAHANYDLVFAMIEKDTLTYVAPERFVTRRYELQQKKPGKEVVLDHNSLTVKDKQGDLSCSTKSELELFQAMRVRRRALTFDLLGLCSYEIMNNYHSELLQHMQEEPPPGYSLPTLKGQFLARVQAANHLYNVIQKLCRACHEHGVLFSIENPARSFFWQTTHVLQFLADVPHFCTRLHHCMFGSARRKYTLLVHNIPTLQELAIECDNSHPHEPWGTTDTGGWATALETAYPRPHCRAIAAKVALYLQQLGTICVTPAFALQTVQLEHIRHDTGLQTSSKAVPLVSEFKEVLSWPLQEPLPALARALSTPVVGEIASENFRTIGVHRSPEEFIIEALEAKHPGTGCDMLPEPMQQAISFCAKHGPEAVARGRSEFLRKAVSKAKELAAAEEELKATMSERRKKVLAPKRMLLFKWMLEESGFGDKGLFDDICSGFDLTGTLPESNTFAKRMRPANIPTEELRNVADKARGALLASMRGSGDDALDEGVYAATMKELDKGFLCGPVDAQSLPQGATLTRRFGVVQGEKVRPIDDYKASLVNASVTQPEVVCIHSIDHIAGLGAELLRAHVARGRSVQLVAKCWDLASAYKQVPLSEGAYEYASCIVVFNPRSNKAEIFQQLVLPFGSDKMVPYDQCCKVLGIELNLTKSPSGTFTIANTRSRKDELCKSMQSALDTGLLSKGDAEKLRGRLQFASNHIFGRRLRNCLRELNLHINRGLRTVVPELAAAALRAMIFLVSHNEPRIVETRHFEWVHMYVDAAYEPDGFSGIGGVLYDSTGECIAYFSEVVTPELVEAVRRPEQKTVIFELEGLAIAVGLDVFTRWIKGKRVIVFTDNQSAQSCVIKCKSANVHMDQMIRRICSLEEKLGVLSRIERVPSQSNPADELSRKEVEMYRGLKRIKTCLLETWRKCEAEPLNASVHSGEWREGID